MYRKLNFFQLATNPSSTVGGPLTRLFPDGHAVFILDGCFRDKSKNTLGVIKHLIDRIVGRQSTKIMGRPELLDWLYNLAYKTKQEETDPFMTVDYLVSDILFDIHKRLQKQLDSDPAFIDLESLQPSEISPVYYVSSDVWPHYAEAVERSQVEADEIAVGWFSGWASDQVTRFRKFTVVTTASDQQVSKWQNQHHHVSFFDPKEFSDRHKQR